MACCPAPSCSWCHPGGQRPCPPALHLLQHGGSVEVRSRLGQPAVAPCPASPSSVALSPMSPSPAAPSRAAPSPMSPSPVALSPMSPSPAALFPAALSPCPHLLWLHPPWHCPPCPHHLHPHPLQHRSAPHERLPLASRSQQGGGGGRSREMALTPTTKLSISKKGGLMGKSLVPLSGCASPGAQG